MPMTRATATIRGRLCISSHKHVRDLVAWPSGQRPKVCRLPCTSHPPNSTNTPELLAADILRLCKQAAMSAGIRLRENLLAAGIDRDLVNEMKLPRPEDLSAAEERDDEEADAMTSWLRR